MKVPGRSQKGVMGQPQLDSAYKTGVCKRQKYGSIHLFSHGERTILKGNQYDQGSGGKFSWQKLKQMLSCFEFFPVAFLANWGRN